MQVHGLGDAIQKDVYIVQVILRCFKEDLLSVLHDGRCVQLDVLSVQLDERLVLMETVFEYRQPLEGMGGADDQA